MNEFVRSVLCIDDDAYKKTREFDSEKLVNAFASHNILCTLYSPSSSEDFEKCIALAKKADVLILDWRMFDVEPVKSNPEDVSEDVRGKYANGIILGLVRACQFQAKLIFVYTAETCVDIVSQTEEVLNKSTNLEICRRSDGNGLSLGLFKIVYVRKGESPSLNDHKLYYDESQLPDFVLKEYADMTSGLLQQFAIFALNLIRNNTSEILAVLSSDSDYAYLVHKASQIYKSDSINLVELIFLDLIKNLISSNIEEFEDAEKDWICNLVDDPSTSEIFINNNYIYPGSVGNKNRIRFISEALEKCDSIRVSDDSFFKFASLAQLRVPLPHDKNLNPYLSLGTILKCVEYIDGKNDTRFYLCIQPKCDSVRLKASRFFLFLPLVKLASIDIRKMAKSDIDIIVNKDYCFKIDIHAYDVIKIEFVPNSCDRVQAIKTNGEYVFHDISNNVYHYLGELAETYASREVNRFAAQLGRIGIDEFEWLRQLRK